MRTADAFAAFQSDPPKVHRARYRDTSDEAIPDGYWPSQGTWTTDADCYDLIARHVNAESTTLETGLGFSTILFALLGSDHTCLFLDGNEEAPLRDWAAAHDIDMSRITFVVGPSDVALQRLDCPVDLYLIDGGHGFPLPQVDWFYGAGRLPRSGVLVLDDIQLPAPWQLDQFVDADPRWDQLARTAKWSAYSRLVEGPVAEDFDAQPFLAIPEAPLGLGLHLRRSITQRIPACVKAPVKRRLHPR